ncbi:MAG: tellurite resistance/C4-dicarboxylate transporter family protein [Acidimicrobiia bacterium]|nr:tellurite resistance/C4-dicarboxylate transporter family protein [Acidimicrobiia bacterium]
MKEDVVEVPAAEHTTASWLEGLNPAWFAFVMATGIVSTATHLEGLSAVADVLLWITIVGYVVLWILLIARIVLHAGAVRDDLGNHMRGMGFFTIVAGTAVLGTALLIVGGRPSFAKVVWVAALALWAVLVYAVPVAQMLREPKPEITDGITGTWLVWVVATQGVSLLGTSVARQFGTNAEAVILLSLCLWLLGVVIYIWVMAMILQRLFFGAVEPADLSPTYWVTMGAVAISTVAGSVLVLEAPRYPITADLLPFLKGLTTLLWAVATYWIPWLVVMGVWRYVVRRYTFLLEPGYWAMVFPLGMYTVACLKFSDAIAYPPLADISAVFVWVALVAWILTFVDMIVTFVRKTRAADAA